MVNSQRRERVRREEVRQETNRKYRREKVREEEQSEERQPKRAKRKKSRGDSVFAVFREISWLRRVESRPAKAASAEPSRGMTGQKMHAVVAQRAFGSQNVKSTSDWEHFC